MPVAGWWILYACCILDLVFTHLISYEVKKEGGNRWKSFFLQIMASKLLFVHCRYDPKPVQNLLEIFLNLLEIFLNSS